MPTTENKPEDRIHQYELKKEKFKPTGIKESTLRRLNIAREILYSSFEREAYLIIERALEMYYHNTSAIYQGRNRNLREAINEMERANEGKTQD